MCRAIINVICDAALIYGYAEEQRSLDRRLLTSVVDELESTGILLAQRRGASDGVTVAVEVAGKTGAGGAVERAVCVPADTGLVGC